MRLFIAGAAQKWFAKAPNVGPASRRIVYIENTFFASMPRQEAQTIFYMEEF
jgi:hypothetical protein